MIEFPKTLMANELKYKLRNALGQSVISGKHQGSSKLHLNINEIPAGIYIIELENDGEKGSRKITVW